MGFLEVVLLLAGAGLAVISFLVPVKKEEVAKETKKLAQSEVRALVDKEMDNIRSHVDDVVDEAVEYAVEKTERSLERLTNEKIMAVNEYSDTVLQEIHKNHEEAMFLYDMLNAKHTNLKNTVTEVNKAVQDVAETKREAEAVVNTFQQMKPEAETETVATANVKATQRNVSANIPNRDMVQPTAPSVPGTPVASPTVMNFMTAARETQVNSNERILELYRDGKTKEAIAKELGLGVGEVKLVLNLYRNL